MIRRMPESPPMLDVRRLRLLVELSQRGTLAAVAEALSYSPSSVSQQLSQLETEAGVPLLVQVGRRVQLTPQAELLVGTRRPCSTGSRRPSGCRALAHHGERHGAHRRVPVRGARRGAAGAHPARRRASPSCAWRSPSASPSSRLFEVAARDFDLVIAEQYPGYTRPHHPELDRVPLARRRDPARAAAGGLRRSRRREGRPRDPGPSGRSPLAAHPPDPWVLEPEGTASREWAEQLCRQAGFEPDVRFETADLMAHIRLIRSGNAVGLLPDLVWAGEAATVQLVALPGDPSARCSRRRGAPRRGRRSSPRATRSRAASGNGRPRRRRGRRAIAAPT